MSLHDLMAKLGFDESKSRNPEKEWKRHNTPKIEVERIPLDAPKRPDKIRIVCISDTHSRTSSMAHSVPPCDILIHAGDFTRAGRSQEFEEFNHYLGSLTNVRHKIVIAGNHEITLDPNCYQASKREFHLKKLTNCTYLEDSGVRVMGLSIYGSPWQPIHANNGFQLARGEPLLEKWNKIPNDVDILITHGPPLGYGDDVGDRHVGCVDLANTVRNRVRPKYHIFGHIHEGYGMWTDGVTTFINASICNNHYSPVHKPMIIDVDPPGRENDENHVVKI